jgi:ankyrin repeat protein
MYRVQGIPPEYNAKRVQKVLRSVLELDGTRGAVQVRSIAISPDQKTKMATADFKNPLACFSLNRNEWSFEILDVDGSDAKNDDKAPAITIEAASGSGHEAVVRLLLEKRPDVNAQGGRFGNALRAASERGYEAVVRLLLEKGADVNAQGGEYGNALQVASHGGHEAVVRLLLEKGADVNAQGGRYGNALQAASRGGHKAMVRLLFEKGADVNAQDERFGNALQAASESGYEAGVRLLPKPNRRQLKIRAGKLPRTVARERNAAQSTYDESPPAVSDTIQQPVSTRDSATSPSQSGSTTREHVNAADRQNIIDRVARNEIPTSEVEEPSAIAQPTYDDASSFAVEGNPACEIIKRGLQLQRHASQFSLIAPSMAVKTSRIDDLKGVVESYVNAPVLWWPLRQRRLASQEASGQVVWQCVSPNNGSQWPSS